MPAPRKVRIRIFRHLTRDAREPVSFAEEFQINKRAFKAARIRECTKVEPAIEFTSRRSQ